MALRCVASIVVSSFALSTSLPAIAAGDPVSSVPEVVSTRDLIAGFIAEAAQRFGIPTGWVRAVVAAESGGDPAAVSPKGAMGLMQIMPETWSALRDRYDLGSDPFDPRDNILAGAAYLRELHDRYGDDGFLAAYNAGPTRYEDHLATGRPLPAETQAYLATLTQMISGESSVSARVVAAVVRSWTDAPLFVPHGRSSSAKSATSSTVQPDRRSNDIPPEHQTDLAPQSGELFIRTFREGQSQ
jgi:hypothetical protein